MLAPVKRFSDAVCKSVNMVNGAYFLSGNYSRPRREKWYKACLAECYPFATLENRGARTTVELLFDTTLFNDFEKLHTFECTLPEEAISYLKSLVEGFIKQGDDVKTIGINRSQVLVEGLTAKNGGLLIECALSFWESAYCTDDVYIRKRKTQNTYFLWKIRRGKKPVILIEEDAENKSYYKVLCDCITVLSDFQDFGYFHKEDISEIMSFVRATVPEERIKLMSRKTEVVTCATRAHVAIYKLTFQEAVTIARKLSEIWRRRYDKVSHTQEKTQPETRNGVTKEMVRLFKDGKARSVQTDATDEKEFREQFAAALATLVRGIGQEPDAAYEIAAYLEPYTDICCRLRGYKAERVREQRVLTAGDVPPSDADCVATVNDRRQLVKPEEGAANA